MAEALTVQSYYESILQQSDSQQYYITTFPGLASTVRVSTTIIELTDCFITSPFLIKSAIIFFQKSFNQSTAGIAQCTAFDSCPAFNIGENITYSTSAAGTYLRLKYVIAEDRMSIHTYASSTTGSADLDSIGNPVALLIGDR